MFVVCADGSCSGNPGPGGWAAIVKGNSYTNIVRGNEDHTTNIKMELMAVLRGLQNIPIAADVDVVTDSEYVVNAMTKGYKRRANKDLWAQIDLEAQRHRSIAWRWVKGHDGHPDNEEVNRLAQLETTKAAARTKGASDGVQGVRRGFEAAQAQNDS